LPACFHEIRYQHNLLVGAMLMCPMISHRKISIGSVRPVPINISDLYYRRCGLALHSAAIFQLIPPTGRETHCQTCKMTDRQKLCRYSINLQFSYRVSSFASFGPQADCAEFLLHPRVASRHWVLGPGVHLRRCFRLQNMHLRPTSSCLMHFFSPSSPQYPRIPIY
jgi:hypothetical protein